MCSVKKTIKLYIDFKLDSSAGAGKFCKRLSDALEKQGVCMSSNKECNIALRIIRGRTSIRSKWVLRVDGVHIEKDKGKVHKNKVIVEAIKKSNYVIFQSEYCRKLANNVLGFTPERNRVIFNGANPNVYAVDNKLRVYKKNVIISNRYAVTKGKTHKRLKEMVGIAVEYCETHKDVGFWFAGKISGKKPNCGDQIKFLGDVPEEDLRKYVATADVMLHLAWYDPCPNSVVEALVAGTPVICASGSGTEEIVGDAGSALNLGDVPLGIITNSTPPQFNSELVYDALDKWLKKRVRVKKPELYINNIARQYKEVFYETIS